MSVFSFSHPPINLLKDFDKELQDFSYIVLKNMGENNEQPLPLDKKTSKKRKKCEYPKPRDRAASVFHFNPFYTSATAHHLLRMVNKNPLIFRDALWKRCVNICCFGGNQAVEIVALSKILSSAQECFWQSTREPLHLKIYFVDKNRIWKKTIRTILKTMTETQSIFDSSTMSISFGFIDADFSKPFNTSVRKVIGEADIITMVKFFCPRRIQMLSSKISSFVQDVATTMKNNAILFYLDSGINLQWEILNRSMRVLNCIRPIYGPIKLEAFTLDLNSIKRCVQLFWSKQQAICVTSCIVSSCAWIKTMNSEMPENTTKSLLEINKSLSFIERKKLRLKALSSEYALQKFHLKVCQIVPNTRIGNEDNDFCISDYSQEMLKERVLFPTKTKFKRMHL